MLSEISLSEMLWAHMNRPLVILFIDHDVFGHNFQTFCPLELYYFINNFTFVYCSHFVFRLLDIICL